MTYLPQTRPERDKGTKGQHFNVTRNLSWQNKSRNFLGQKNRATSLDNTKSKDLLGQKKSWNLSGQNNSHNHLGQKKIMHPLAVAAAATKGLLNEDKK